ncbi:MAG: alanine--tRNA ligase [Patescibacteria group bacterium]|nr:alanine--tRNA ligase [Patescibacteria group bacterium]
MTSRELREKFLKFFEQRGHIIIPSASLVPEKDPTTLFTGSGMQPLIPYLLGQPHPLGKRLVNSQKCFRAEDIEEVGDNRHTTFFEMLGNWSLGDYFKEEQLSWFFEFLTKEVNLDPNRLYITVFSGDPNNNIPRDDESVAIWKELFAEKGVKAKDVELLNSKQGAKLGMQGGRIFYYDSSKNWWSRSGLPENMPSGEPGGPDSEVFYEFVEVEHDSKFGKYCHPNCNCGRFLEIGNSVFMEYKKNENGSFDKLLQKNVDFGGGLERITAAANNSPDIFEIDLLSSIIKKMEDLSGIDYGGEGKESFRIIADHMRAASFMIADGVRPSNVERGYFIRRLVRRAVRHADTLKMSKGSLVSLINPIVQSYADDYPEIVQNKSLIEETIKEEEDKFRETLEKGLKVFEKISVKAGGLISGRGAFDLYQTYGFPLEMTLDLAKEKGIKVDEEGFRKEFQKHQKMSRTSADKKFKGGLADTKEETVKLHTAHHLLLAALQKILGPQVKQRGSNITSERLRIDFSHSKKMTTEELKKIEDLVNQKIKEGLNMIKKEMSKEEAENIGAEMEFGVKYSDIVSVYLAEDDKGNIFSKEFCGGPHVKNTKDLGHFKITKEESVASGIRRIKAILE